MWVQRSLCAVTRAGTDSTLSWSQVFLLEQFSRFANAYFLLVCVLQLIPSISITGGLPTAGLPLVFVLLFDGIVTAREDYKRHQDDHVTNTQSSELVLPVWPPRHG